MLFKVQHFFDINSRLPFVQVVKEFIKVFCYKSIERSCKMWHKSVIILMSVNFSLLAAL